jgi:hypothetical protein
VLAQAYYVTVVIETQSNNFFQLAEMLRDA